MSGLDINRFRNKTVTFRLSPEEFLLLHARQKISGKPKGQFIIEAILEGEINIVAGKYESDRLALEIKKLNENIANLNCKNINSEAQEKLLECKIFLESLTKLLNQKLDIDDIVYDSDTEN